MSTVPDPKPVYVCRMEGCQHMEHGLNVGEFTWRSKDCPKRLLCKIHKNSICSNVLVKDAVIEKGVKAVARNGTGRWCSACHTFHPTLDFPDKDDAGNCFYRIMMEKTRTKQPRKPRTPSSSPPKQPKAPLVMSPELVEKVVRRRAAIDEEQAAKRAKREHEPASEPASEHEPASKSASEHELASEPASKSASEHKPASEAESEHEPASKPASKKPMKLKIRHSARLSRQ